MFVFCGECEAEFDSKFPCKHMETAFGPEESEDPLDNDEPLQEDHQDCFHSIGYDSSVLLITAVKQYPPLWDSRLDIKLRSKPIKDDCWWKVYQAMKEKYPVKILQNKWKNLKDAFAKHRHERGTKKRKRQWKHYNQMSFLDEIIAFKLNKRNTEADNSIEEVFQWEFESPSQSSASSASTLASNTTSYNIRQNDFYERLLAAVESLNKDKVQEGPAINPVCIRLSEILSRLDDKRRLALEIKLLQVAYDATHS